jgi:hypothetical protein
MNPLPKINDPDEPATFPAYEEWTGESLDRCPARHQGHMVRLSLLLP